MFFSPYNFNLSPLIEYDCPAQGFYYEGMLEA
jgi:hypothetical protein